MATTSLATKMISNCESIKIGLLFEFCYYYINIGLITLSYKDIPIPINWTYTHNMQSKCAQSIHAYYNTNWNNVILRL